MIDRSCVSRAAALAAIASLGACNKGPAVAMEQGEWETTVQVTNVSVENLPPELRRGMGDMQANRSQTTRGCMAMTADVIRIQNLRFTVPEPAARGAGCQVAELVMEGGVLRGRMTCTGIPAGPMAGGAQTMTMSGEFDGSYTATSAQATARGEIRFGAQSGGAAIRLTSRRLGACPPPRPYMPPPVMTPDMRDTNVMVPVVPAPMPAPMPPPRVRNTM